MMPVLLRKIGQDALIVEHIARHKANPSSTVRNENWSPIKGLMNFWMDRILMGYFKMIREGLSTFPPDDSVTNASLGF
jgi:hypothetical protein